MISCKKVFYADFESDTTGQPPEEFPPGNPTDDRINFLTGAAEIIQSSITGHKCLKFSRTSTGQTPFVTFKTGAKPHNTSAYSILIKGYSEVAYHMPELTMMVKSATGDEALRLTWAGGNITLQSGSGTENIGTYSENVLHQIWIVLNTDDKKSSILISKEGESTVTADDKPFIDATFGEIDQVYFEYPPAILEAFPGAYVFDEVEISKKE